MGDRSPVVRRVAALFAWDIVNGLGEMTPERLAAEGYELLALDTPAAVHLLRASLPFSVVEDWIDDTDESLSELQTRASELASEVFAHDRMSLSTEGVHWPSEDYYTIDASLITMLTTVQLARALAVAGVTEFRCFSGHPYDPLAPNRLPQPVVAEILARLLPGIVLVDPVPEDRLPSRLRRRVSDSSIGPALRAARRRIASYRFGRVARRIVRRRGEGRLILTMLSMRELDRSGPIVHALADRFGDDLIAVPWMNSGQLTRQAGDLSGIPWLPTPPAVRGTIADERCFARAIAASVAASHLGELEPVRAEVLRALLPLAQRWGTHAERLRWAKGALRALRPRLVVASRDDIEYQVPIEAARVLELPTITLPHGVVHWVPPHRLEPTSSVVHLSGTANPSAPPGSLRVTTDALITYEYPRRRERLVLDDAPATELSVLVLTDGFGRRNHPAFDLRAQQQGFRILAEAARSCGLRVRMLLKPHPAMDERAEAALLDGDDAATIAVLPRATDVMEAIAASDLIIGLNCTGSVLVHTVMADAPVLRLSATAGYRSRVTLPPRTPLGGILAWRDFWDASLVTVEGVADLANALRRFATDAQFAADLRSRSRRASVALRPSENEERLEEILDELLR